MNSILINFKKTLSIFPKYPVQYLAVIFINLRKKPEKNRDAILTFSFGLQWPLIKAGSTNASTVLPAKII